MSEIADNKWELSASKAPIGNIPAIAQILMMGCFALFFGYIVIFSAIGALGKKSVSTMEGQYTDMKSEGGNRAK